MSEAWKRCSTCKKDIPFKAIYYVCSVSTCTRKRTGFHFCCVECWEAHLPMMRHREAWAVEETAPTKEQWAQQQSADSSKGSAPKKKAPPRRTVPTPEPAPSVRRRVISTKPEPTPDGPKEILVIASRLKNYIKKVHDLNCSDGVLEPLSEELRRLANRAVRNAVEDGRKTVLERDMDFLKRQT